MMKEKTLLEELMSIPTESTQATLRGIEMEMISQERREELHRSDPDCLKNHEAVLKNGLFLWEVDERGLLCRLYKVEDPNPKIEF